LILDVEPLNFIKKNWFEALLMLIIVVNGFGYFLFKTHFISDFFKLFGFDNFDTLSNVFIQFYFLIIIAIETGKASHKLLNAKLSPYLLLTLSFVALIVIGSVLLMLPEMTVQHYIRPIDSVFTITSACCVTGLTCVDTATFFTLKGQIIIMIWIKLGGLNILSFAAFFATFYKDTAGIKYQSLIKDLFNSDQLSDTKIILRNILFYSIAIEIIGSILIFIGWSDSVHFSSLSQKIYYSVFHSISAFNNAGFSLYTNNLYEGVIQTSYFVHITIAFLIIFGGIGFSTIHDIFSWKKIKERRLKKWKKFDVNTRVIIWTTTVLIVVGTILFYLLERNNTLKNEGIIGTIIHSFFQSVTTRTAGFNTLDIAQLTQPILLIMIFLMFVGASPGSTGGGIKTTTFFVIYKSVIATIRGKKNIEIYQRNISFSIVDRAYSIVIFALTVIFISSILLTITEPNIDYLRLLFEEVSAFGTVGLSTGITAMLSDAGKIIIILSMFIGRIGPLTLALALSTRVKYTKYKYAEANIMIG